MDSIADVMGRIAVGSEMADMARDHHDPRIRLGALWWYVAWRAHAMMCGNRRAEGTA